MAKKQSKREKKAVQSPIKMTDFLVQGKRGADLETAVAPMVERPQPDRQPVQHTKHVSLAMAPPISSIQLAALTPSIASTFDGCVTPLPSLQQHGGY